MKLIRHTILRVALLLIPFTLLGGIFIYYMITFISYEEIDEFLNFEMERIVRHHEKFNDLPDYNTIAELKPTDDEFQTFFKDTLLLETGDMEMVPYRELHFSLTHNGDNFHIVLRHLLLGRDDIAKGSMLIIIGLTALFFLMVLIGIGTLTKEIWRPFFKTLDTLKSYSVQKQAPEFTKTKIQEFKELNSTLKSLLEKMSADYNRIKEFNENAAHELQTQLAIIKNANDELLNGLSSDEKLFKEARKVQVSATKLSHMLRSLLLMSKIGNKEFQERKTVDLQNMINTVLEDFQEVAGMRNITIANSTQECVLEMDEGLALVMITNLVKNAVKHNINGGVIEISNTPQSLEIVNTGTPVDQAPSEFFQRYSKGVQGIHGVGLSIVKQICDQYDFHLDYTIAEKKHRIAIRFK